MDQFYYFNLLRHSIIQTLKVFSDIKIAKYNKSGSIAKYVQVPLKFAGKDRFYLFLNDRSNVTRLPMMSLALTGMQFDRSRAGNLNHKYTFKTTSASGVDSFFNHNNLYPWNLDFTLMVATEFMVEMDQIMEQTLPFFDPVIVTTMDIPEVDIEINLKIVLNNVSPRYDVQLPENQYRTINYELGLTTQTFLMRPKGDIGIIKEIFANFYTGLTAGSEKETILIDENFDG